MFLPHPRVKVSIVGILRGREVACSASDRQGSNFESCVWRTVSSQSSHHPQEVLLAQFSLYVHKGGLKPESFPFFTGTFIFYFTIRLHTWPVYRFTPLHWTSRWQQWRQRCPDNSYYVITLMASNRGIQAPAWISIGREGSDPPLRPSHHRQHR